MKTEILKCLKESGTHISGQELCRQLGVSRTAVWKVIRQLQEEGYRIEAIRNKGYLLVESADVLTEAELTSRIKTEWAGQNLSYCNETDSTNNQAKRLAELGAAHGTLAVAEIQTAGKGRRGRRWVSPEGTGIWMSILLRPQIHPSSASMLTLVAAMATAKGINAETGLDCSIKWPNDLVLNGKKIVGILTEMSTEQEDIQYVVTGIGINVNIENFPEEISSMATSLRIEGGMPYKRSKIIAAVMTAFELYYEKFLKTQDLSELIDEYNGRLVNCGKEVRILAPGEEFDGVSGGIDKNGRLLVMTADGREVQVVSGEVSVRGLYGYV